MLVSALSAAGVSAALSTEPLAVTCSAEKPTVALGETVLLRAWASAAPAQPVRYAWEAVVGRLAAKGPEARWDLANLRPGTYAASVRLASPAGVSAECLLRVIIRRDPAGRGPATTPPGRPSRETGSSLLLPGQAESQGYGLYTYLLLGSPPSDGARERHLRVIEAFWSVMPEIARLEEYVPRQELNIAYLPVKSAPAEAVSGEWILQNYDYARARALLRLLPGTYRDGPYIVSVLRPLGGAQAPALLGPHLFQDMSQVSPHLVSAWVKEFLNQAAQERFWEEQTGRQLALKLRLTIGILGVGLPEVQKALDSWIAWVR